MVWADGVLFNEIGTQSVVYILVQDQHVLDPQTSWYEMTVTVEEPAPIEEPAEEQEQEEEAEVVEDKPESTFAGVVIGPEEEDE